MENLRKLRTKRHLTQIGLGMKTGIDQSLLSKYERGARVPGWDDLIILADFFGTSVDYLMDRTDTEKPYPPKNRN